MLHFFHKWRYERKNRMSAFELPSVRRGEHNNSANLGSYLSGTAGAGHNLKPFDLPRKRRRLMRILVTILLLALIAWITYESIIALAFIVN